eukprot:TRINITY_DN18754_c0_g1_i1.p1 TRINITY_DN18754_c0_g1~~TRINITY_DN18754_c0_g1_i1.p1  ORF type:complete len:1602 (-),score=320.54 TRINITY_DN18754_c0_g1_i1:81-4886(-)
MAMQQSDVPGTSPGGSSRAVVGAAMANKRRGSSQNAANEPSARAQSKDSYATEVDHFDDFKSERSVSKVVKSALKPSSASEKMAKELREADPRPLQSKEPPSSKHILSARASLVPGLRANFRQMEKTNKTELPKLHPPSLSASSATFGNQKKTEQSKPVGLTANRAVRQLHVFKDCSEGFLAQLVAGLEHVVLKPGEHRDLGGRKTGPAEQATPAAAVIVLSGTCRVEIAGVPVEELSAGQSFGLASVLAAGAAGFASTRTATAAGTAGSSSEAMVRACGSKAQSPNSSQVPSSANTPTPRVVCSCILLGSNILRTTMQAHASDQARLRSVLPMLSRNVDGVKRILAALQCNEGAKTIVSRSTSRHIFMPGETLMTQGKRNPDALLLILSGTVAVDIGGVEVRRITEGQVVGEEMLLNVTQKWMYTGTCVTPCDVMILYRKPFTALAKKAPQGNSAEESREFQRLLVLLEGRWKEDRVILSLPLFRGLDGEFLGTLAKLMETRVVLPGDTIWASAGSTRCNSEEFALFVLLHGTAEEHTIVSPKRPRTRSEEVVSGADKASRTKGSQGRAESKDPKDREKDTKKVRRLLVPGAYGGSREILGLQEVSSTVVARSICLTAILHRSVFVHACEQSRANLEAPDVTKLLREELNDVEPLDESQQPLSVEQLIGHIPALRGQDEVFMERLCNGGQRRFCMEGQHLCRAGMEASEMIVVLRGEIRTCMAGITLAHFGRGKSINLLALATNGFIPSFDAICTRATEVWVLSRSELQATLEHFPAMKRIMAPLTAVQTKGIISADPPLRGKMEEADGVAGGMLENSKNRGDTKLLKDKLVARRGSAGAADQAANFVLKNVLLFSSCSTEFREWIRDHLETKLYFPDDIIFREGEPFECLFMVCKGCIVWEGRDTDISQDTQQSYHAGSTLGEPNLLGVAEKASGWAVAIEPCLVQELHRAVLLLGLEQFPDQATHMHSFAVDWLNKRDGNVLAEVPFLKNCTEDLQQQLARYARTRLIVAGELILEKGATSGPLCIIRSGTAMVESGPRQREGLPLSDSADAGDQHSSSSGVLVERLRKWDAANAALVMGLVGKAPASIRAETLCAVTEIDTQNLLTTLQRFKHQIPQMVRDLIGGQLWPSEVDSVPFFRNVSQLFFNRLIEVSDWAMYLADKNVVKQGTSGSMMFLMCYGAAVAKIDGVVVGNPLVPGDVIGKVNFLGVTDKYPSTIRTQTVCHFRVLRTVQLDMLLPEQPTERETFEHLKAEEKNKAIADLERQKVEVTKEKRRRRVELAFQKHVAAAKNRFQGTEMSDKAKSIASKLQKAMMLSVRRSSEKLAACGSEGAPHAASSDLPTPSSSSSPRVSIKTNRRKASIKALKMNSGVDNSDSEDSESTENISGVSPGLLPSEVGKRSSCARKSNVPLSMRASRLTATYEHMPGFVDLIKRHEAALGADGKDQSSKLRQKWLYAAGNGDDAKSKEDMMENAIDEFCKITENKKLRGRLLRLMRNGYPLGDAVPDEAGADDDSDSIGSEYSDISDEEEGRPTAGIRKPPRTLSKRDLNKLDALLPALPSSPVGVKTDHGDIPKGLVGQILLKKFQQLTKVPVRRR